MKSIWKSRGIWVNFIAILALILQIEFGFILALEAQAAILMVINLLIRFDTDVPLGPKSSVKIHDEFIKKLEDAA